MSVIFSGSVIRQTSGLQAKGVSRPKGSIFPQINLTLWLLLAPQASTIPVTSAARDRAGRTTIKAGENIWEIDRSDLSY
jgi:hypothetical protein